MNRIVAMAVIGMVLQACAWVTLTPEGEKARVLSASEVTSCKKLGKTTVTLRDEVAGFERNPDKVIEELQILARNSAAELKGDTVVPVGEHVEGKQTFDVYRCINP
jgi:hypothetical protein